MDYFWVDLTGADTWDNSLGLAWSATSGGPPLPPGSFPSNGDGAFFDANSGTFGPSGMGAAPFMVLLTLDMTGALANVVTNVNFGAMNIPTTLVLTNGAQPAFVSLSGAFNITIDGPGTGLQGNPDPAANFVFQNGASPWEIASYLSLTINDCTVNVNLDSPSVLVHFLNGSVMNGAASGPCLFDDSIFQGSQEQIRDMTFQNGSTLAGGYIQDGVTLTFLDTSNIELAAALTFAGACTILWQTSGDFTDSPVSGSQTLTFTGTCTVKMSQWTWPLFNDGSSIGSIILQPLSVELLNGMAGGSIHPSMASAVMMYVDLSALPSGGGGGNIFNIAT